MLVLLDVSVVFVSVVAILIGAPPPGVAVGAFAVHLMSYLTAEQSRMSRMLRMSFGIF